MTRMLLLIIKMIRSTPMLIVKMSRMLPKQVVRAPIVTLVRLAKMKMMMTIILEASGLAPLRHLM